MDNYDDPKLRELLQEWQIPGAPGSLDGRVLAAVRKPWWTFLLTGSIRVPVPVGLAVAAALLMLGTALFQQRTEPQPAQPSVSLADFQPVSDLNLRVIRPNETR